MEVLAVEPLRSELFGHKNINLPLYFIIQCLFFLKLESTVLEEPTIDLFSHQSATKHCSNPSLASPGINMVDGKLFFSSVG